MDSNNCGWPVVTPCSEELHSVSLVSLPGERLDELVEIGVNVEDTAELGESPAAEFAKVVDAGNPIRAHGVGFLFCVLAAIAFDLYDKVERLFLAVVNLNDEIRKVFVRRAAHKIRDFKAETLILDVSADARVCLGHAAKFRLPIAVANHPVDVAFSRVGFPARRLGRREVDVGGGALRVVSVEDGFDGRRGRVPSVARDMRKAN